MPFMQAISNSRAAGQLENEQYQLLLNEGASLPLAAAAAAAFDGTDELEAADELLLQDKQLAEVRRTKRARRAIAANKQLFSNPHFAVFPAEGAVNPHSELEVTLQFAQTLPRSLRQRPGCSCKVLQRGCRSGSVAKVWVPRVVFSYDVPGHWRSFCQYTAPI